MKYVKNYNFVKYAIKRSHCYSRNIQPKQNRIIHVELTTDEKNNKKSQINLRAKMVPAETHFPHSVIIFFNINVYTLSTVVLYGTSEYKIIQILFRLVRRIKSHRFSV